MKDANQTKSRFSREPHLITCFGFPSAACLVLPILSTTEGAVRVPKLSQKSAVQTLLRNDRETDRRRWIEERAGDVADLAELISNPFAPFQVKTEVRASATVAFRER